MEITFADIFNVVSLLLGGGGLRYFFSWRYNRRKEKAEVEQAETTAAKEMQDMYQQLIEDVKRDRDEQKAYIVELKEDRQERKALTHSISYHLIPLARLSRLCVLVATRIA